MRLFLLILFLSFSLCSKVFAGGADAYLKIGWAALIQDKDEIAILNFSKALEIARNEENHKDIGNALLYLGISAHGVSYSQGLRYADDALKEFALLEKTQSKEALVGRSRCLQLISTIYGRQGNFVKVISLSKQALLGFDSQKDTTGTIGLIYNSLGTAYKKLGKSDSVEYFYRKSLAANLETNQIAYLPSSYLKVADLETEKGNKTESFIFLTKAQEIAFNSQNKQAQVLVQLSFIKWFKRFNAPYQEIEKALANAKSIATELRDRSFLIRVMEEEYLFLKNANKYSEALSIQEQLKSIRDTLFSRDKEETVKRLEIQFEVSEKNRQLQIAQQEKDIAKLTTTLLGVGIFSILIIAINIILFLRKINARNKQLISAKEELLHALHEQKKLEETKLQNEIDFKESKISALAIQMLQKNELLQQLNAELKNTEKKDDLVIDKIIHKSQNQDKEWSDFNVHFESINKNFYQKIKDAYPEISPNDLKLCALIKLNMSIKEMAGILNISPDSVKTARYRLRKKFQLNTEDNLTEFILKL